MGTGMPLYWSINSGLSLDRQMDLQLMRGMIRGLVQDWYWIGQRLTMDWRIGIRLVNWHWRPGYRHICLVHVCEIGLIRLSDLPSIGIGLAD